MWTFGRDLLIRGMEAPAGEGDVHVSPAIGLSGRAMVSIELSSPDGHLVLLARAADIIDFIARSVAVVSPGTESDFFDVDMLISQVLAVLSPARLAAATPAECCAIQLACSPA